MAVNWMVREEDGRTRFLNGGGLGSLLAALNEPNFIAGVAFTTRKLAMEEKYRKVLLSAKVHTALINKAVEVRFQYIALSLI